MYSLEITCETQTYRVEVLPGLYLLNVDEFTTVTETIDLPGIYQRTIDLFVDSYSVTMFRPIQTALEYQRAVYMLDGIMSGFLSALAEVSSMMIETLSLAISEYEAKRFPIPDASPEALRDHYAEALGIDPAESIACAKPRSEKYYSARQGEPIQMRLIPPDPEKKMGWWNPDFFGPQSKTYVRSADLDDAPSWGLVPQCGVFDDRDPSPDSLLVDYLLDRIAKLKEHGQADARELEAMFETVKDMSSRHVDDRMKISDLESQLEIQAGRFELASLRMAKEIERSEARERMTSDRLDQEVADLKSQLASAEVTQKKITEEFEAVSDKLANKTQHFNDLAARYNKIRTENAALKSGKRNTSGSFL